MLNFYFLKLGPGSSLDPNFYYRTFFFYYELQIINLFPGRSAEHLNVGTDLPGGPKSEGIELSLQSARDDMVCPCAGSRRNSVLGDRRTVREAGPYLGTLFPKTNILCARWSWMRSRELMMISTSSSSSLTPRRSSRRS